MGRQFLGWQKMGYVALGVAAFVMAGLIDLAALHGWRHFKQALGVGAVLLWGYALYGLVHTSTRFWLPRPLVWAGWLLFIVAASLFIYSVFIEIPFGQTYVKGGMDNKLVTTGTYALCRHPGVLWFGLWLIGLIFTSRGHLLVIAAPLWFLSDVLWVWAEDVCYFPRIFPEYDDYQQVTPMLVPTRDSIGRCLKTLRFRPGSPGPESGW